MIRKYSTLKYFAGATKEQIAAAAKKLNITPEELLNLVHNVDPTNEKKFEAWLIKQMSFKNIRLPEDGNRVAQVLNDFISLSNKKQLKQRDIQQYRRIHDLEAEIDAIKGAEVTEDTSDKLKEYLALPGVRIFAQNTDWLVLYVDDPDSAAQLALGTKWCTSDPQTAADYIEDKFLLIFFQKVGKSLTKTYQATADFSNFFDIKDGYVETIPPSLVSLITGDIYNLYSDYYESNSLTQDILIFLEKKKIEIPRRLIEDLMYNLEETSPTVAFYTLKAFKIHALRDIFFIHPVLKDSFVEKVGLIQSYFNLIGGSLYTHTFKTLPRWKEFEEMIENLPREQITDGIRNLILNYLSKVDKFGRWEEVDNLLLDMGFLLEQDLHWFKKMIKYLPYNDVAGNLKWQEFEDFLLEIMESLEGNSEHDLFMPYGVCLAVEYWIRATPERSRWTEMEPFILKYGSPHIREIIAIGGDEFPLKNYERHISNSLLALKHFPEITK